MRILLFGKHGQLGWELQRTLSTVGEVIAYDYPEVDFTQPHSLHKTIEEAHPEIIVNAAAYTNVDRAEKEPKVAQSINALAPGEIAETARRLGATLIHFSTDFVFDGMKGSPYIETDPTNPLNVYGTSKLEGEKAVQSAADSYLILRTSWVYSLRRDNFVMKVLRWARSQTTLKLVRDQIGSPTWARLLAEVSAQVLVKGLNEHYDFFVQNRGVYHLAGEGQASRFEFGKTIISLDPHSETHTVQEIGSASSDEFPTPAKRPLNTALDCRSFRSRFGIGLPPWETALQLMFAEQEFSSEV